SRSVVDTTGVAPGFAASYGAVALNENTTVTGLLVRRAGATAIYVDGTAIAMSGVRVVNNRGIGIQIANNQPAANGGSQGLTLSGFAVDSNQVTGPAVSIESNSVQLVTCDVWNSLGNGIITNSGYAGIQIHDCNIMNNGRSGTGLGVANNNLTNGTLLIDALDNFWGLDGTGAPIVPLVGTVNGISLNVNAATVRPTQRIP